MNKRYGDSAKSAAAKFITLDDADQMTEPTAEPKKKRGRPRKAEQKPQSASEAPEAAKARKAPAKRKKAVTATDTKPQRKSDGKAAFSVWLNTGTAEAVKRYSAISGTKMTDVCEAALTEYMNRHKLTEDQKTAYKQKMMQNINDI